MVLSSYRCICKLAMLIEAVRLDSFRLKAARVLSSACGVKLSLQDPVDWTHGTKSEVTC